MKYNEANINKNSFLKSIFWYFLKKIKSNIGNKIRFKNCLKKFNKMFRELFSLITVGGKLTVASFQFSMMYNEKSNMSSNDVEIENQQIKYDNIRKISI